MGNTLIHIGLYEKLLELSHGMIDAAEKDHWEEVITLEQERSRIVDTLRSYRSEVAADQQSHDMMIQLIEKIQKCDDKIYPALISHMDELKVMIDAASNELKLGKQYGHL